MTAQIVKSKKALSVSPLKTSQPLGAALAFMGLDGCLPLFHGSQGCTAFALVMMVRHFREAIPLQTTAMNEISTILGGMDNVEQALLNIRKRAHPRIIGLMTTGLTETRGEDLTGDLKAIRARKPELADTEVVFASTPDFSGSLEEGWGKAVTAMIETLVPDRLGRPSAGAGTRRRVNILAGAQLTPGDIEEIRDTVERFGMDATVLPDLSGSLDGHVPERYIPHTLGGTTLEEIREMGGAAATIAIGQHMSYAGEALERRTGVKTHLLQRLTGLDASDRFVALLSEISGRPVPDRLRRQRSQLLDAMLDGHMAFGGSRLVLGGEPDTILAYGTLAAGLGAVLAGVVLPGDAPHLADLPAETKMIGDLDDLGQLAEGCDLMIANANGRLPAARAGVPLFRVGFPVIDRLGAAHRVSVGYRGTREAIFALGNALISAAEAHHAHPPATPATQRELTH